jgi:hypothetical protein
MFRLVEGYFWDGWEYHAGVSRTEYLRRRLESEGTAARSEPPTLDDLKRAGAVAADLLDEEVMRSAWR